MTTEVKTKLYEGLFLFPQAVTSNLQDPVNHIKEIITRADGELVSLSKWDERRLAYEIKGNKRGVYFLTYFNADPQRLTGLERDCNLSEKILRSMVTRADHLPAEVVSGAEGQEKIKDEIKMRAERDSEKGAEGSATIVKTSAPAAAPAAPAAPATPPPASDA